MANAEHMRILRHGVEAWNRWRLRHGEARPRSIFAGTPHLFGDLSCADLRNWNLNDANFERIDLRCAILAKATLVESKLIESHLEGADFSEADLSGADLRYVYCAGSGFETPPGGGFNEELSSAGDAVFTGANLRRANLGYANITNVDLRGADLTGAFMFETSCAFADLTGALIGGTVFSSMDISAVKGLDSVIHVAPSTIGLDTIYESAGRIPDVFLRGAGVPEEVIDLARSIRAGPAIQWYSCFISYSTKDDEFSRRLHSRMRDANMRVWFAPEDLKGGKKLHEQLFEAIQMNDRLLLVLSEHSIQSEWVMTEIRKAREVEKKENRRKLFPIRLTDFETLRDWTCFDADSGKDLAVEVREYFIPDFSNWRDHDAFEAAFARLKKDLEAENLRKR